MLPLPPYVIFLDIDGVLLSERVKHYAQNTPLQEAVDDANGHKEYLKRDSNSFSNNYWSIIVAHHFSEKALRNLDSLIQQIEAVARPQIVISSKWRRGRTVEELKTIYLRMHSFAKYIIDKTPDEIPAIPETSYPGKAEEIQFWLDQHPEYKHYVILDDEEWAGKYFKERFIHVHGGHLLSENDVERALAADPLTASYAEQ